METRLQNQTKPSSQPASSPQPSWFQQRPFTDSIQPTEIVSEEKSTQNPNLQTQPDRGTHFSHNFGRVQVSDNPPSAIQPQVLAEQPGEQNQEKTEPEKLMAAPISLRQNYYQELATSQPLSPLITPVVQRQDEQDGWLESNPLVTRVRLQHQEPEELVQAQALSPFFTSVHRQEEPSEDLEALAVQPKLVIGAPGDRYEQEADQMAMQVMSMSAPPANSVPIQRQEEEQEQEPLVQRSSLADSITPLLQRQIEEQEEPLQTKSLLQRAGNGNAEAGNQVESQLNQSKGGGSPLPDEVRSFMEPRFGVDFSAVRVHTDSSAVQMNKDLHAQAFTHGSDIYYGSGQSPAQDSLTAHELTHVVQQTGAKKLQQKPITSLWSNKETLQAKISPAFSFYSPTDPAIQLKEAPDSPQGDPRFQAVVNKTKAVASQQKAHPPAKVKADQAQAAAKPPANEIESKAQEKQVQEMNQQQPGKFHAEAFKAALMQKIESATPKNLEQADQFKDNNQLSAVKQDATAKLTDEKKQASGSIEEKTKEAPKTDGIEPKPVTPLPSKETSPKPGDVGAEGAAPKPKDALEVSLEADSKKLDQQMVDANVTEEQLAKSNEPQFQSALGAKKDAQANAITAPQDYRQKEQATVTQAQAQAQNTAQTQLEGMHGSKEQLLAQVLGKQGEAKGEDEQKRAEVASKINGFYNATKTEVETILNNLDKEVVSKFDAGAVAAKQKFETFVAPHMETYKQRYDGLFGAGRWIKDKLLGLPPAVTAFFTEGRQLYLKEMDKTINDISNHVATQLNLAKKKIADGKQQIQDYVTKLPENLRQVGQEAAQNIQSKFDELESSVDNKQNELVDSLAQKYNENLQQLDAQLAEMKASNRTWMDAAMDAVGGAIKTILEMKNMLMGVLAKAAGAIDKIITDPIGFLGNLITGIKQGFQNFAGNISAHLKKGMLAFLTGALAGAGITMPESFDLKGIFSLVMQVLGVVYDAIKSRCVKALGKNGEKMFNALESSFEMFVILKNEGIAGLWQFIQDKIGDLKAMVIDTIQTFVVESVIKSGVMWVLSLLNPASAFVRACKAIYDIIMFFIERGSQIAELVSAVTESVGAIASGAVGGAAKLIENALGTALPVVISFMASLLGLGGISEKIEGIIKTVRQPIDKAIDWLIAQAVTFAKKIGNKLGFGNDKKDGKESKEGAIPDFQVQEPFSMSGEGHKLTAKVNNGKFEIIIASNPQEFESALTNAINEVNDSNRSQEDKKYYLTVLRQVLKAVKEIKYDIQNNKGKILKGVKLDPETEKQALEQYIKTRQAEMANQIQSFAATAKIKSLDNFYKAPPSERYVPGYPSQTEVGKFIRQRLYDSLGWNNIRSQIESQEKPGLIKKVKTVQKSGNQDDWQQLVATGLVEPNATINNYDPEKVEYHVDHIEPLSKRWNQKGHDSTDSTRLQELGERTNLRLVTGKYNTSKGSGGIKYLPYVGLSFTSQFAEGGINGALKIHGQPFLDASGKPLV